VVLARRWQEEWGKEPLPESLAFLIVMLQEPLGQTPLITSKRVAVCLPQESVAVSPAVREPRASYAADVSDPEARQEETFSLPTPAIASFSRGRIVAGAPFEVRPQQVFNTEQQTMRLDLLAGALLERVSVDERPEVSWEPYLTALASALAAPHEPGIEAADAAIALTGLRRLVAKAEEALKAGETLHPAPLVRLRTALGKDEATGPPPPDSAYGDPLELAEDAFFCRCLLNDSESALGLAAMRDYLEQAVVPDSMEELAVDHRVTLEQLSSASLLFQPHRLESMRATFEFFRKRYGTAYCEHHSRYRESSERLLHELRELEPQATALRRLNELRGLGKPLGLDALETYEQALATLQPCPMEDALPEVLRQSPLCPMCHLALADEPSLQRTQRIATRLDKALRQQQNRLAERIIKQILSIRDEKRIDLFLKIVQATQLQGIAEVLDDDLISFLRELLAQEDESAAPVPRELARSSTTSSSERLEAAVQEFRRLLQEALAEANKESESRSALVDPGEDEGEAPGRRR
jgi:hypothetical protein